MSAEASRKFSALMGVSDAFFAKYVTESSSSSAAPMSLFVPVSPGTPATAQPPAQSTPAPQQSSFSSEPSPVPKKKRVMGKGGRPLMNRGPGRPKSGGIHIPDDELYKYHLGLISDKSVSGKLAAAAAAAAALADKHDCTTHRLHVKMCVLLRNSIKEHGLKDPSIISRMANTDKYGAMIRLDAPRLINEGITSWDLFVAKYLGK